MYKTPDNSKKNDYLVTSHLFSILETAEKYAKTNDEVLITGETGSGKEYLAQYIHENSTRIKNPFNSMSCANMVETLFESELFGYERGAHSMANKTHMGLLEMTGEGTLFLDEVGDTSPANQARLLRLLSSRKFRRIGGDKDIDFKGRFIFATKQNLEVLLKNNKLRDDFYFRINVLPLKISSLRERGKEEIKELLHFFNKYISNKRNQPELRFSSEAMDVILNYSYPGNVRQLENLVKYLCTVQPQEVQVDDIRFYLNDINEDSIDWNNFGTLTLEELKGSYIKHIYGKSNNNKTQAAKKLGLTVNTLNGYLKTI